MHIDRVKFWFFHADAENIARGAMDSPHYNALSL